MLVYHHLGTDRIRSPTPKCEHNHALSQGNNYIDDYLAKNIFVLGGISRLNDRLTAPVRRFGYTEEINFNFFISHWEHKTRFSHVPAN